MKVIWCLFQLVFSAKYLITKSKLFDDDILFKYGESITSRFSIGDLDGFVMEASNYPFYLFNYQNVINVEEDQSVTVGLFEDFFFQKNFVQDTTLDIWHLDRIDQRSLPLDSLYHYSVTDNLVDVYVVDTGIDVSHPNLGGRAKWGANFADKIDTDCQSHGTHVSGLIASNTFGVSKNIRVIAVKVLDCQGSGSYSTVIAGLEWVAKQKQESGRVSIVSMSLGGPKSNIVNKAIKELSKQGIHVIVASGNESGDACKVSPASSKFALTVGATDNTDKFAYFSNFGKCVDILSPGVGITSTIPGNKTAMYSGSSMSTPLVAGVYSMILSKNPELTPSQMKNLITNNCTKGMIKGVPSNTPNCLLYSLL